jgi:hypothetical protein
MPTCVVFGIAIVEKGHFHSTHSDHTDHTVCKRAYFLEGKRQIERGRVSE